MRGLVSARRLGATLVVVCSAAIAASPAQATFPGANGKIVFQRDGHLWTIDPDGTDPVQLTSAVRYDFEPRWSPDGSAIAFERTSNQYRLRDSDYQSDDIFIVRGDEAPTEFGTYAADDYASAWSPDGQKLVFITELNAHIDSVVEQPAHLATANLDGSGRRILVANTFPFSPDWSPLGTPIVYPAIYDLGGLEAVESDGSNRRQLTEPLTIGDTDTGPSWSPDGNHIAFSRHREATDVCEETPPVTTCHRMHYIFVANADGSGQVRLSPDPPVFDFDPAWSPDGSQIAFVRYEGEPPAPKIYIMDADGGNAHYVTDGSEPDWQPLTAPRHLHPPHVAGQPREGLPSEAKRGLWLGTPAVQYGYQWSLCDVAGENCADIAGATEELYTPTHEDVSHTLRVTVTASNDYGQAAGTSDASVAVGSTFVGTSAGELLTGTAGSDLVWGGDGADTIRLGTGNDVGHGGRGRDEVAGGEGNDRVFGGFGRDRLRGGAGRDFIFARDGIRDVISCGSGWDYVRADRRDRVAPSCEVVRRR